MERFQLQCLGIGDGKPCPDRSHSAYLYQWGDQNLLLDCGEPVCRHFKAGGLSFAELDHLFLSHFHFDHLGGFFMFIQGCWLEGRRRPLPVYLPGHGVPAIKQVLQVACLFEELLPFPIHWHPLEAERTIDLGKLRVTPYSTTHLDHFRTVYGHKYPGNFEAYAFLLEAPGRRVVHSADLGAPEDLDPLLAKPVDLLVCEMAHFEPAALFAYLRKREIKQTVFTHLGRPYWENLAETTRQAEAGLPGRNILFAQEQSIIPF